MIIQLFEKKVHQVADQVALIAENKDLTYSQLNQRANDFSNAITIIEKELGKKLPLIGVCLERSFDSLAAILGILKASKGYVPLDQLDAGSRLQYLIKDTGLQVIITSRKIDVQLVKQLKKHSFILYAEDISSYYSLKKNHDINTISSNGVFQILYTSGTTGNPKGVILTEQGILNRVLWMQKAFPLDKNSRVLHKTSYTFDVSVGEIFWPLLSGATLVLAAPEQHKNIRYLANLIAEKSITHIHFIPALLAEFVRWIKNSRQRNLLKSLKYIFSSGEALPSEIAHQFFAISNAKLFNLYGPTEAGEVSYFQAVDGTKKGTVPIGFPISNVKFYILDKQLKKVFQGGVGELYVAGICLAEGYLNLPALTKEKFIKNPFKEINYPVIYKTGDKVQQLLSGAIEFIGRFDDQIKLGGFRIEPLEVESVILQYSAVVQCAVRLTKEKVLVAYFVGKKGDKININQLKEFLKQRLPYYSVPSSFIQVDKFPTTKHGKINYAILARALREENNTNGNELSYAVTSVEKKILNLWEKLLGITGIKVHDNFFHVGGQSLVAIRMCGDLYDLFGIDLTIEDIFNYPTVFALSNYVNHHKKIRKGSLGVTTRVKENFESEFFPMTDIQKAYLLGRKKEVVLGGNPTYSYLEIDLRNFDIEKFEHALNIVIQRHEALRCVYFDNGCQKILNEVPKYKVTFIDLSRKTIAATEKQLLLIRKKMEDFLLGSNIWPMFVFKVSKFKNLYRLHVGVDAIALDAYSLGLFFKELSYFYSTPSSMLLPLNYSIKDYIWSIYHDKKTKAYRKAKKYWIDRLANFPLSPELPLRADPSRLDTITFSRIEHKFSKAEWNNLKLKCSKNQTTASIVMLAAYAKILQQWSSSSRFSINLTLFQRRQVHPDVEKLMGDFTSIGLLEVPPAALNETFLHWFSRLQAQLLKDLAHVEYNGTELLSELSRHYKKYTELLVPTVFTSTLHVFDVFDKSLFEHSFLKIAYQKDITSQVWLDCQVSEVNGELILSWDYVNELFFSDVVAEMFSSLVALVKWLTKEDWTTFLPNLIQKKTMRLIEECNNQKILLSDMALYEGLLAGIKNQPNHIALVNDQRSFSYKELYQLARVIYFFLQNKKFKPGQAVVIVGDRAWEQVPIILGVLLAGGIYVPVASCWPKKRIENILSQVEPSLVFLDDKTFNVFSKLEIKENFYSFRKIFNTFKAKAKKLVLVKDRTLPAYIIYTSGSTGDPKGVVISHQAALNTIVEINRLFSITSKDCVLALSDISFDLSVYDIFGLLLANGKIVLPTVEELKNPAAWIQLIVENNITIWNSTPAFMQMLVDYVKGTKSLVCLFSIRVILLSGDWISIPLVREIKRVFPSANVISLGGATEASIWSIYYPIKKINSLWKSIPYGKALSNQGVVVLNEILDPCPMRVAGEIYIYGEGLAVQYWKDIKKTAEKFITHPRTGLRLYKTGDIGRLLPTGNIELLGRKDNQIKRLGQRIELSEIENVIRKFEGVEDAVVIYVGKFNKIIAYVKLVRALNSGAKSSGDENGILNNRIKKIADLYFSKTSKKDLNQFRKGLVFLNKLALFAIAKTVYEIAIFLKIKCDILFEELIFQISPRYQKLFNAWLFLLKQHKLLQIKNKKISFKDEDFYLKGFNEFLHQSNLYVDQNKELKFLLHYLSVSIKNHKDILRNKINPLAILFPDGNFEMAESAHQHNPLDSYYNKLATSILEIIVNERKKNGCEILELGAGVGGLTVYAAPILQQIENVSYKYTDISSHFIINAKKKFRSFNFIEYGLYNIDFSPEEQGYKINSYDVLIAGNCLHDAKNIEHTLKNLKKLLVPSGYLIMIEGTQTNSTYLASYGFLNDYDDERKLENFPFLSKTLWVHLLKSVGFQHCFVFEEKENTKSDFSYSVIVAQLDSIQKEANSQSELKSFLHEHLPPPMIPDEIFIVKALPVTDNGKINRKLLEEKQQVYFDNDMTNNESQLEDLVALIFKQVLGGNRIKPTDNFFDCGGDSLSLIKLFALLKSKVDNTLTVNEVAKNPTIRGIANLCEDKKRYAL